MFDKSFYKDLDSVKTPATNKKIIQFIEKVKTADSIRQLSSVKKMKGFKNYYRFRMGDYRIGFENVSPDTIIFIVIAKRSDIYKLFP